MSDPQESDGDNMLRDFLSAFAKGAQKLADAINTSPRIQEWLSNLPDPAVIEAAIARLPADVQRALAACGFPSVNSFFSIGDIRQFVNVFDNEGRDAALHYVEEGARAWLASPEERDHLLESWAKNTAVAPRMAILRDALNAHAEQKYTLSVPVFMIQIEGLLFSFVNHTGRVGGKKYIEIAKKLVAEEDLFGAHVGTFIEQTLLQEFRLGDTKNFDLSRHAVLHGADVTYGTELNSLRIIALFDYIVDVIQEKLNRAVTEE